MKTADKTQESIRQRHASIEQRRAAAKAIFEAAKQDYDRINQELDQEEADLRAECKHPDGRVATAIMSHSECPDCGLSEMV